MRLETPDDYRETENVMREAFWNVYSPGCSEHYLLHVMRGVPEYVPELAFLAVAGGRIVGAVAFLKSWILTDDGRRCEVLSMGPIAVLPEYQRTGIGRKLIAKARSVAAGMGHRAILLCGNPDYYPKVGFVAAGQYGIRTSENKYFAALHVCPLYAGALDGLAGRYYENEIYNVPPGEVEEFDRLFPEKERLEDTPSQKRFKEICAMQRDYEL